MSPKAFFVIMGLAMMGSAASLQAQNQIKTSVIANGGGKSANSSFQLLSTVGQPVTGLLSNQNHVVVSGFWSQQLGVVTGIEQVESDGIPQKFRLEQNYPNPFNPSTTITFQLPQSEFVTLKVFDLNGREVATLVNRQIKAGNHTINFNASQLASGVYFYRLDAGKFQQTRKMLLVR